VLGGGLKIGLEEWECSGAVGRAGAPAEANPGHGRSARGRISRISMTALACARAGGPLRCSTSRASGGTGRRTGFRFRRGNP
jgi:hypothetical protein